MYKYFSKTFYNKIHKNSIICKFGNIIYYINIIFIKYLIIAVKIDKKIKKIKIC